MYNSLYRTNTMDNASVRHSMVQCMYGVLTNPYVEHTDLCVLHMVTYCNLRRNTWYHTSIEIQSIKRCTLHIKHYTPYMQYMYGDLTQPLCVSHGLHGVWHCKAMSATCIAEKNCEITDYWLERVFEDWLMYGHIFISHFRNRIWIHKTIRN